MGNYFLKYLVENFHKEKDLNKKLDIAKQHIEIRSRMEQEVHIDLYPNYPDDIELFTDIEGYEGIYQIGNWGTLKASESFFIKNRRGHKDEMAVYKPERIRTYHFHQFGYPQISLWKKEVAKYISIHRLVAIHFIPNPNNLPQVLHKDDNAKNPKWDNLEWGTQSKNIQDAADRGRGFRGAMNGNSKLKNEDIPKIRQLISEGVPSRKIAKMFGVTKTPILWIRNNKSWVDV